jgi:hypothetical protein
MMMVQRELRVIPRGWEHPTDGFYWDGKPRAVGLCPREYLSDGDDDFDEPLTEADVMPSVEGFDPSDTQIAAYETVSDGTPISPAFDNTPEGKFALVMWLAENEDVIGQKVDGETWAAILFGRGCAMMDIHTYRIEIQADA